LLLIWWYRCCFEFSLLWILWKEPRCPSKATSNFVPKFETLARKPKFLAILYIFCSNYIHLLLFLYSFWCSKRINSTIFILFWIGEPLIPILIPKKEFFTITDICLNLRVASVFARSDWYKRSFLCDQFPKCLLRHFQFSSEFRICKIAYFNFHIKFWLNFNLEKFYFINFLQLLISRDSIDCTVIFKVRIDFQKCDF